MQDITQVKGFLLQNYSSHQASVSLRAGDNGPNSSPVNLSHS